MSTNDPFDFNFDLNSSAYDQLIKDAETDNRVGNHSALVSKIEKGAWPDGRPRLKVLMTLTTANNSMADWTFSPPLPPDQLAAVKSTLETKVIKGMANNIATARQLAQHYGVTPGQIKEGDSFKVKTRKDRVESDGSGGFIRIAAFLPKDAVVGVQTQGATPTSTTPF